MVRYKYTKDGINFMEVREIGINKDVELSIKLSPFKFIENTIGCVIVKSNDNVKEIKEYLKEYIVEEKEEEIHLINGSIITIIKPKSNSEVVRGRRSNIPIYFDDFERCNINVLDNIVEYK